MMPHARPTRSSLFATAAVILLLSPGAARAEGKPSFDCAKVSSVVEKTICASEDLSGKDRALAASYAKAQTMLSEDGKAALRGGQRQWIKMIRDLCDTSRKPKESEPTPPADCLARQYENRQTQLDHILEPHGGIVFRRVDRFGIYPPAKGAEPSEDPGILEVSYPQIEAPTTPAQVLWNKTIATRFEKIVSGGNESEDQDTGYTINLVSPRLISLTISDYSYGHGAAHGNSSQTSLHWLLDAGRELRADDVFDRTKDWRKTITASCLKSLSQREFSWVKTAKELGAAPFDPTRWTFGADGLTIHFNPYEVASHADGPQDVVVPWNVLRGLLVKDPPVGLP